MSKRQFAYGRNTHDGVDCPARAAGYDTEHGQHMPQLGYVTSKFDDKIGYTPSATGVVDGEKAKQAWVEMIDYYRLTRYQARSGKHTEKWDEMVKLAIEIAEELEWDVPEWEPPTTE